ncbi:hypothetical protein [Ralstonia pseudosolanacearum]|nr:hypothetical protein [Ralstonia pseudosolanacearum]
MTTKETAMRKLSFKNIDADSITIQFAGSLFGELDGVKNKTGSQG